MLRTLRGGEELLPLPVLSVIIKGGVSGEPQSWLLTLPSSFLLPGEHSHTHSLGVGKTMLVSSGLSYRAGGAHLPPPSPTYKLPRNLSGSLVFNGFNGISQRSQEPWGGGCCLRAADLTLCLLQSWRLGDAQVR